MTEKTMMLCECVYDLTTIADFLIKEHELDVDSRDVFFEVAKLAEEFDSKFNDEDEDADYLSDIEEYGFKKLKEYFGIEQRFTGCVSPILYFDVKATSEDEAGRMLIDKLKDAGFKVGKGGVDFSFN